MSRLRRVAGKHAQLPSIFSLLRARLGLLLRTGVAASCAARCAGANVARPEAEFASASEGLTVATKHPRTRPEARRR